MVTQVTDETLLAASFIRARFLLGGKSDIINNQDITFIEKVFREYPDQERIRKHHCTTYDKVRNERLPEDKWLHLVSIFRGYFGIIVYPDLPEGSPVILPTGTEEDLLLSAIS